MWSSGGSGAGRGEGVLYCRHAAWAVLLQTFQFEVQLVSIVIIIFTIVCFCLARTDAGFEQVYLCDTPGYRTQVSNQAVTVERFTLFCDETCLWTAVTTNQADFQFAGVGGRNVKIVEGGKWCSLVTSQLHTSQGSNTRQVKTLQTTKH